MSLQSGQVMKNGLRKALRVTAGSAVAIAVAGFLTYAYLQGKAYRQERAQWAEIQGFAAAEDFSTCRAKASALSSQSRYFSEAQRLAQRCGLGVAQQQAESSDLPAALETALGLAPTDEQLQAETQALIADWSQQILAQGQQLYEAGQLQAAIATLDQLPDNAPATQAAADTVQQWQTAWASSETALTEAEQLLSKGQWLAAKNKLSQITGSPYWQQRKRPLLAKAEAGIAEVARYEAEVRRQQEAAAAATAAAATRYDYDYEAAAPARRSTTTAPQAAYIPPPPAPAAPSINAFDQQVESLYNSYVAQGQNNWDAWVQACQASGGYIVDQGPQATCAP